VLALVTELPTDKLMNRPAEEATTMRAMTIADHWAYASNSMFVSKSFYFFPFQFWSLRSRDFLIYWLCTWIMVLHENFNWLSLLFEIDSFWYL